MPQASPPSPTSRPAPRARRRRPCRPSRAPPARLRSRRTTTGGPAGLPSVEQRRRPRTGSVHSDRVGARCSRPSSSRLSCRSIISTSAPSSRATRQMHWPIGPAPRTTHALAGLMPRPAHGAHRRSTAARPAPRPPAGRTSIGNTWFWRCAAAPGARRRRGSRSSGSCRTCSGGRRGTGSNCPHAWSGQIATRWPIASSSRQPAPTRDDPSADLVALDAGELGPSRLVGQLAEEEVVVRAADPDCLGGEHHLAGRRRRRLVPVDDRDRLHPAGDRCAHRSSPPFADLSPRPRPPSRRSASASRSARRR